MLAKSQLPSPHPSEAVLRVAAERSCEYLREVGHRRVAPAAESLAGLVHFHEHIIKGRPLEYVLSALLKLLQKGAPFYDQH